MVLTGGSQFYHTVGNSFPLVFEWWQAPWLPIQANGSAGAKGFCGMVGG